MPAMIVKLALKLSSRLFLVETLTKPVLTMEVLPLMNLKAIFSRYVIFKGIYFLIQFYLEIN
jgi:hypothetical protein